MSVKFSLLLLLSPSIIGNQLRQDGDDHGNSLLLAVLICTFISIYSDILARKFAYINVIHKMTFEPFQTGNS